LEVSLQQKINQSFYQRTLHQVGVLVPDARGYGTVPSSQAEGKTSHRNNMNVSIPSGSSWNQNWDAFFVGMHMPSLLLQKQPPLPTSSVQFRQSLLQWQFLVERGIKKAFSTSVLTPALVREQVLLFQPQNDFLHHCHHHQESKFLREFGTKMEASSLRAHFLGLLP